MSLAGEKRSQCYRKKRLKRRVLNTDSEEDEVMCSDRSLQTRASLTTDRTSSWKESKDNDWSHDTGGVICEEEVRRSARNV